MLIPRNKLARWISLTVLALFCFNILHAIDADAHAVGAYDDSHGAITVWEDGKHCAFADVILDHTSIFIGAETWTESTWWYGGSTYHEACGRTWGRDPSLIRVQAKVYHRFTSSQSWVQCTAPSFGWRYNTRYTWYFNWTRSWSYGGSCGVGQYYVKGWVQTLWNDGWHGGSWSTPVHTF